MTAGVAPAGLDVSEEAVGEAPPAGEDLPCCGDTGERGGLPGTPGLVDAARAAGGARGEATAATAEKPIEKEELIREVEALERAAEADGEGGAYNLAAQALAEARAMRDRVGEIEAMAAKADWAATLDHASWIGAE